MSQITFPASAIGAVEFKDGNEYVGVAGQTRIKSPDLSRVTGSNVKISNVIFEQGGIRRDGGGLANLVLENVEFRDIARRPSIEVNGGGAVTIRKALWENCDQASWIGDMINLLIESVELRGVGYGLKCFGDSSGNRNRVYRNFWIHNCGPDFMALELQGAGIGCTLEYGLIEDIAAGPSKVDNDHSLILSAPLDKWTGVKIYRVAVLGKKPRDAEDPGSWINGHPALLEAGGGDPGSETVIEECLLDGGGTGVTVTDRAGPCRVRLKNNRIRNVYRNWNRSTTSQEVVLEGQNDANTPLPWTLEQLRAVVGRSGASPPPPTTTPPPVDPAITDRLTKLESAVASVAQWGGAFPKAA
jgi:hypothetical protein